MYSYNRVQIIGYQTQPVVVRQTPSGASVTDLNIVAPYTFRSENGETLQGKSFHTVTVWGPMADIAGQFIRPGSHLFISGRLQTDSWDDQQTGEKRSKTKIVALDLIILDPKNGQLPAPEGAALITQSQNRADIVGNVTRDPELRTTPGGKQVLTLGVATNERWRDRSSGENHERTEFHNVVVWGDLAESVQRHMHKGNRVYVTGRVQTRSWETQSGAKRYTTEIIADTVLLLGISSAAAQESISADAAPVEQQERAPAAIPSSEAASEEELATVAQYSSEIKAEDLPF